MRRCVNRPGDVPRVLGPAYLVDPGKMVHACQKGFDAPLGVHVRMKRRLLGSECFLEGCLAPVRQVHRSVQRCFKVASSCVHKSLKCPSTKTQAHRISSTQIGRTEILKYTKSATQNLKSTESQADRTSGAQAQRLSSTLVSAHNLRHTAPQMHRISGPLAHRISGTHNQWHIGAHNLICTDYAGYKWHLYVALPVVLQQVMLELSCTQSCSLLQPVTPPSLKVRKRATAVGCCLATRSVLE